MARPRFIRWFSELGLNDVPLVGGKNASLGELYCALTPQGIMVPNGFAITAAGYRYVLQAEGIDHAIRAILADLDTHDITNLAERGREVRELILNASFPNDFQDEILEAYATLCNEHDHTSDVSDVAVRSSATAEDLPDASFAGQQDSFLNIRGDCALLDACKRCMASLFTDRAISYRVDKAFDHFIVALSICIQRMVRADLGSAGVLFTLDTESGFRNAVLINSAYGLGESVVQGRVDPDEFLVFKPTLKQSPRPIIKRSVGAKQEKLVYADNGAAPTCIVPVPEYEQKRLSLTDEDVLTLAHWACLIEDHYSAKAGHPQPMDIEWAKDGNTGALYILQARPETVHAQTCQATLETYHLTQRSKVLLTGKSVGEKIGTGPVRVVHSVEELSTFQSGEVLVTDITDPDWEPMMKMASAIVTNRGGRTCHAAIVSRELGVPCIVGTERATQLLQTGQPVTASCADGEVGTVYEGTLPFTRETLDVSHLSRPQTKIMMNVGNPEQAFRMSSLPNDGVGLAREEFIISSTIQIHPLALVHFDTLPAGPVKEKIARLTCQYRNKSDFFVDRLAEGVGQIAAAFYPKDVIVRLSDFKSNEYASLLGGEQFEPHEENPMLGFRGASRYYDERYRAGFLLECRAMKKVREEMGLINIKLMIPFCRTVEEGRKVLAILGEAGLTRGENGLELYMMCELPANVILAEEFADLFDGFSIGSNDLTQLTLGLDRDSSLVAHLFDERNPAVSTSHC